MNQVPENYILVSNQI